MAKQNAVYTFDWKTVAVRNITLWIKPELREALASWVTNYAIDSHLSFVVSRRGLSDDEAG